MISFFFSLTALGAVAGALMLGLTLAGSQSAPQQAAGAAIALALAIIPYVFSRCIQIVVSETYRREENQRLVDKLAAIERTLSAKDAPRYEIPEMLRVHA